MGGCVDERFKLEAVTRPFRGRDPGPPGWRKKDFAVVAPLSSFGRVLFSGRTLLSLN